MARNVVPNSGRPQGGDGGGMPPPRWNDTPPTTNPGNGQRGVPIRPDGPGGPISINGGPTPGSAASIGQASAGYAGTGRMPFMQTPGMRIASQREDGSNIQNDPAISAALADFNNRVAPGIQNQSNLSGLGRSTANLNALTQAQASMLTPMYQDAFARDAARTNRMGTAAENELGRDERSSARVADANQSMAQMLASLSQNRFGNQQTTGQNLMQAGGQLRDVEQQGNQAEMQDYLRRQALGENAVGMPFGGLASGGLGSITNTTGK